MEAEREATGLVIASLHAAFSLSPVRQPQGGKGGASVSEHLEVLRPELLCVTRTPCLVPS